MVNNRVLKLEVIDWQKLKFIQQDSFKEWVESGDEKLIKSLLKYQFVDPFKVWQTGEDIYCLDGFHRVADLKKIKELGYEVPQYLPATFIDCKDSKDAAELVLVYSSFYAKITESGLSEFIKLNELDWGALQETISLPEMEDLDRSLIPSIYDGVENDALIVSLNDRFIVPPFSILDTRKGYWQERKIEWISLGINSQESREDVELIAKSGQSSAVYELRNKMRQVLNRDPSWDEIIDEAKKRGLHIYEGASIFDPVLTELSYRWFCPDNAIILDPFAGGSVRGIVAGILGYDYIGIDIREDQVEANKKQWDGINKGVQFGKVKWTVGDSNRILDSFGAEKVDFVYSCPPYFDLEKYSDDPNDLSNMEYEEFCKIYRSIITKAVSKLKMNRFACFVVGDIRSNDGAYRNFVSETIDCFIKCIDEDGNNVKLYNEIVLVNVAGSLPIRVGRQFEKGRKVGKMHQNVLVFYKGDIKEIKNEFPVLDLSKEAVLEETEV